MSIVGASGVNLKDLEGLGVPTLTAMAQGQIKSVAPSYMVLAALKSLTDAQKGMMQPQQPTVKDQVVSQAVPAVQQGMGAAAPVAAFADGGSVYSLPPEAGWHSIKRVIDGLMQWEGLGAKDLPKTAATPSKSTATYEPVTPIKGELRYPDVIPTAFAERSSEQPTTATRTSAGIASAGPSPVSRYKPGRFEDKLEFTAKPEDYKLNIPKNQQLIDAYNRMSKPDEARMKEYADERRMSGLAALAQGIMQGRGLGQAIPQAAAGFVGATRGVDKERRAYEDARQRAAMELGIKVGEQDREDYKTGAEYGVKRAGVDDARAIAAHKAGLDAFNANETNQYRQQQVALDAERVRASFAQVKEMALARRDSNIAQEITRIEARAEQAAKDAEKLVMDAAAKSVTFSSNPDEQRLAASRAAQAGALARAEFLKRNEGTLTKLKENMGIQ